MSDPKEIGNKIRALRGAKTIEFTAKEIGISTSALGMYETGKRIPRDEVKVRIANYFHTTVEAIFFTQ